MPAAHELRPHTTRTLLILGVAALAFALAQATLVPALPELMRALHTDESGVSWTLTGYLVAAAAASAVVAACAGVAATVIPRARTHMHAPVLDEIGSAGPLADPAYAREEF